MMDNVAPAGVGSAVLSADSDLDDDGPYYFHGVAIGNNDVTVGQSKKKKKWTPDALEAAFDSLEGQSLVKDHENNTDGVIGTVENVWYDPDVGVRYEASIAEHYKDTAQDIEAGLLDVSPRIYHADVSDLEQDDDGAYVIDENTIGPFDNLSVVDDGASPSNTAVFGKAAAMASDNTYGAVATLEMGSERPDSEEMKNDWKMDAAGHKNWSGGDMVRLKSVPDIFGKVQHVDEESGEVMFEIMQMKDGEMEYSGSIISADPMDLKTFRAPSNKSDMDADLSGHMDDEEEMDDDEPMDEAEELEAAMHTPSWDGLDDEKEWKKPSMEDFDTDDLSEIDNHFFVSKTGEWPPENYGDLALPAVWPNGDLSLDGLDSVHQMAGQVDGISEDMVESIQSKANSLAQEHFDQPVADEEMAQGEDDDVESETDTAELQDDTDDDDAPTGESEQSTRIVAAQLTQTTQHMTNIEYDEYDEADIEEMSQPVVLEETDVESLTEKADEAEELKGRLDEMNSSLEELASNQDVLDDVDEEKLAELQDYDDAVVMPASEHEELNELVESVGDIYAEELEDYSPFDAAELTERWTPLELREKVEDHEEAGISELSTDEEVEPEGGTASEAELEEGSEEVEREQSMEELRGEVADKLASAGYTTQADKVRSGELDVEQVIEDASKQQK